MAQATELKDFELDVMFPETGAKTVEVGMGDIPVGAYKGEITECVEVQADKVTLRTKIIVTEEGPAQGLGGRITIGTDFSKGFNLGHFTNMLVGAGADPAKLKGKIKFKPTHVIGKPCYILVRAPDEEMNDKGQKNFNDKNFITKAQYEQAKKAAAALAGASVTPITRGAPQQAQSTPATETPPAAAQGGGVDLGSMFPDK